MYVPGSFLGDGDATYTCTEDLADAKYTCTEDLADGFFRWQSVIWLIHVF